MSLMALARERTEALRRQVEELLARPETPQHGEHGRTARRLAAAVLDEVRKEEEGSGKRAR